MPEYIDLISSSPISAPSISKVVETSKATSKPNKQLPPKRDWYDLSSDHELLLPSLSSARPTHALTKPATATSKSTSSNVDWLPSLSSDPLSPAKTLNTLSKSETSTVAGKAGTDVFFLSDDFDSTINLEDSIAPEQPATKKRRISHSPPAKAAKSKDGGYNRSKSNIETSTKSAGERTTSAPLLKRAKSSSKALDLDPLIFTSSPDPFADAARRRKERNKQSNAYDSDDSDILDVNPGRPNAKNGNPSKAFDSRADSSDLELPDIGALPSTKDSKKPKSSQTALAKYNAEKERENKALEKEQKKKNSAATKEAEKENKRLAREEKVLEKERAQAMAKVNVLKTDKKVTAKEMIVDLPSSLNSKTAVQARAFLDNLEVEHKEWDSDLPIIKWRRKVSSTYNDELGLYEPVAPHIKKEKHVMYIMTVLEFVDFAMGEEDKNLDVHVLRIKAKFESSEIIFLIQGYNPWMRKNRNIKNRQFTAAVRNQMDQEEPPTASQRRKKKDAEYVDEEVIEDAMLRLQVIHKVLIHHTEHEAQTADWIRVFTEQISLMPYKTHKQALDTAFCMESGQVKSGDGISDTYTKMLQEIVRITAPVAYGIAAEYPTLRKLVDGLQEKGPLALEECRKSANRDGAFTDRRVGPAISKRVYKVFTGRDPSSLDI